MAPGLGSGAASFTSGKAVRRGNSSDPGSSSGRPCNCAMSGEGICPDVVGWPDFAAMTCLDPFLEPDPWIRHCGRTRMSGLSRGRAFTAKHGEQAESDRRIPELQNPH
jgi:hypothetical protein